MCKVRFVLSDCEKPASESACPTIQNYGRSMMVTRPSATDVPLAEIAH